MIYSTYVVLAFAASAVAVLSADDAALDFRKRLFEIPLNKQFPQAVAQASDESTFEAVDYELFTYERFLVQGGNYSLIRSRARRNLSFHHMTLQALEPSLSDDNQFALALTIYFQLGVWMEIDPHFVQSLLESNDCSENRLKLALRHAASGSEQIPALTERESHCVGRFLAGRESGARLVSKAAERATNLQNSPTIPPETK